MNEFINTKVLNVLQPNNAKFLINEFNFIPLSFILFAVLGCVENIIEIIFRLWLDMGYY